jgi:hypothetical protein
MPALRDSFSEDRASDALCQCHHGAVLKVQWAANQQMDIFVSVLNIALEVGLY